MIKLFIPLIAFWIASVTGIPQKFARAWQCSGKPFTCPKCLAFWMALCHEAYFGFSMDSIWYVPLCSLMAWLLEVICIKLKLPING